MQAHFQDVVFKEIYTFLKKRLRRMRELSFAKKPSVRGTLSHAMHAEGVLQKNIL